MSPGRTGQARHESTDVCPVRALYRPRGHRSQSEMLDAPCIAVKVPVPQSKHLKQQGMDQLRRFFWRYKYVYTNEIRIVTKVPEGRVGHLRVVRSSQMFSE